MKARMKAANGRTFDRVGYRFIIERLIKSGRFAGLGQTPEESAKLAPIREALYSISIENAME